MHGYEPGTVEPTTELLMSHKHPDDRSHVQDLQDRALLSKSSFSSRHRFIDRAGVEHDAIVVADRMSDANGAVVGTHGYYLDLTATSSKTARWPSSGPAGPVRGARHHRAGQRDLDGHLPGQPGAGVRRAALAVTRNQHQAALAGQTGHHRNVHEPAPSADVQAAFDHLLLTVHERIPGESTT